MKKILFAAFLLSCFFAKASAETENDTLVIEKPSKVRIETCDSMQRIVINGSKDDDYFHYTQSISLKSSNDVRRDIKSKNFNTIVFHKKDGKPSKWEGSGHLNIGLGTLLNTPDDYKFKIWPSFEIGLNTMVDYRPFGKKNVWSIGFGIDWRNYSVNKKIFIEKDDNGFLIPTKYTNGEKHCSASINMFSLQIPIMYTHYFGDEDDWGISLGGIINFNTYARVNRQFELNDCEYDIDVKKIGQRPITIDGIAIIHIPSVFDVYCKYCPMEMFKDGRGPEAKQLSFGLYF